MHWEQQDNVLYSLSVSPELEATVRFVGSDRVQVTLFYNIRYNLSIVGTLCGQNINTTDVIELHYGEYIVQQYNVCIATCIIMLNSTVQSSSPSFG